MRKIGIFCLFIALLASLLAGCENKSESTPELYSKYLSVNVHSIAEGNEGSTLRTNISNTKNEVFEENCHLVFSLRNLLDDSVYTALQDVVNKRLPNEKSFGCLNLQNGGNYTLLSSLDELVWENTDFSAIPSGNYELQAKLFIDDPFSPDNWVRSNVISLIKP